MNYRLKSGLIVLGLSVAAVPTIGAARTHYTGKVPASIVLDPVPVSSAVTTTLPPRATRVASHKAVRHHKAAAAKKKVVVKHAVKKHHKRPHKKAAI